MMASLGQILQLGFSGVLFFFFYSNSLDGPMGEVTGHSIEGDLCLLLQPIAMTGHN